MAVRAAVLVDRHGRKARFAARNASRGARRLRHSLGTECQTKRLGCCSPAPAAWTPTASPSGRSPWASAAFLLVRRDPLAAARGRDPGLLREPPAARRALLDTVFEERGGAPLHFLLAHAVDRPGRGSSPCAGSLGRLRGRKRPRDRRARGPRLTDRRTAVTRPLSPPRAGRLSTTGSTRGCTRLPVHERAVVPAAPAGARAAGWRPWVWWGWRRSRRSRPSPTASSSSSSDGFVLARRHLQLRAGPARARSPSPTVTLAAVPLWLGYRVLATGSTSASHGVKRLELGVAARRARLPRAHVPATSASAGAPGRRRPDDRAGGLARPSPGRGHTDAAHRLRLPRPDGRLILAHSLGS